VHEELRRLLPEATGSAEMVLAVFLDIRGFTRFAATMESAETAEFLRHIFLRITEEFYPENEFFKLTGDGLVIIENLERRTVVETVNESVARSIDLVAAFPRLCDDDLMINYPTPDDIGVGLARGVATALVSEGKILDFSGRPLNVAARMLDVARPRGVVFHESLDTRLIDDTLLDRFQADDIYVKGVADEATTRIYLTPDWTEVGEKFRTPFT
jgi:class 3 adenylate cyclase